MRCCAAGAKLYGFGKIKGKRGLRMKVGEPVGLHRVDSATRFPEVATKPPQPFIGDDRGRPIGRPGRNL